MGKKRPVTKEKGGIPIEWHIPEGVMTPFATNMIVQTIENEFKISFFEIKPVVRLEDSQPLPDKIRADCVSSVIVTADRLPNFIGALQKQLDKYMTEKQTKQNKP